MTPERKILLNPGPATTTDTVKRALVVPDICPREKEFQTLMQGICRDLARVVNAGAGYTCVLFAGSGTAVMDAAVNSVVPPGRKIAILNNGAYGARMVDIARAYGIEVVELAAPWDAPCDLSKIAAAVAADDQIACLAAVHHETTTGLLNPIDKLGRIAADNGCRFIVDAISSYAGIPIDMPALGIDFLLSTSNKCIQGMAGLAFVICRTAALEALGGYPRRAFYLNLFHQYDCFRKTGQMPFTPPVQVMYALRQAVDEYFEEGAQGRYARYTRNWQTLRAGLAQLGFRFLLKPEDESHILTTVLEPADPRFDFDRLHDMLYARGFTIYPGKIGQQKTFRLANMGAIDAADIASFIVAFRAAVAEMGIALPIVGSDPTPLAD